MTRGGATKTKKKKKLVHNVLVSYMYIGTTGGMVFGHTSVDIPGPYTGTITAEEANKYIIPYIRKETNAKNCIIINIFH